MGVATATKVVTHRERPNSYMVGVKTKTNKTIWAYNGLRFAEGVDALAYSRSLLTRWPDLVAYRIVDSDDPPNCTYPVPSDRYPVERRKP